MVRRFIALTLAPLLWLGAGPALGHSQLVDTAPKPHASLSVAPKTVVLTFNEDLIDLGGRSNAITVIDAKGKRVATTPAVVRGGQLSTEFAKRISVGRYTVWYRAVSADGHPISGRYTFGVSKRR